MSKIPPELEAEMTPAVKALVLALQNRIDELEKQVQALTDQSADRAFPPKQTPDVDRYPV